MNSYEVKLSTGKVVVLSQLTIKSRKTAARNVYARGISNPLEAESEGLDEILKILIQSIDGKNPSAVERENLDNLFTFPEYSQLLVVIQEMGGGGEKKPEVKLMTTSGE